MRESCANVTRIAIVASHLSDVPFARIGVSRRVLVSTSADLGLSTATVLRTGHSSRLKPPFQLRRQSTSPSLINA